eukprot:1157641-Pelagomonas_calceolata.AAC.4
MLHGAGCFGARSAEQLAEKEQLLELWRGLLQGVGSRACWGALLTARTSRCPQNSEFSQPHTTTHPYNKHVFYVHATTAQGGKILFTRSDIEFARCENILLSRPWIDVNNPKMLHAVAMKTVVATGTIHQATHTNRLTCSISSKHALSCAKHFLSMSHRSNCNIIALQTTCQNEGTGHPGETQRGRDCLYF